MAAKKSSKKGSARKRVRSAAKTAGKRIRGAVKGAAKRAKTAASNPRRTVRRAAENVHEGATRAHDFGDSVIRAGELVKETADFVDAVAQRAKTRQPGKKNKRAGR